MTGGRARPANIQYDLAERFEASSFLHVNRAVFVPLGTVDNSPAIYGWELNA
jgi:hypothetical protein